MKMPNLHNDNRVRSLAAIISMLSIIVLSVFMGCGKLSDDTDRPSSPVGTSGGVPIPITPQSSVGTYTLSLTADPDSIFADMINYAVMKAQLTDTSGRSVENMTVNFTTSGNFGWFYDTTSGLFLDNDTSFTDSTGLATTRLYGSRSGEVVVKASIDLNNDAIADLTTTTTVLLRSSGQPSSAGNYTLTLKAYPDTIPADMATYSTIVARLDDTSGGSVENFTITFTGESGYIENDPDGPSSLSTVAMGVTDKNGSSSVYFYGARKGSAVISASVYVNDLVGTLQAKTIVHITEGPGVPGTGVPGVDLSVAPVSTIVDLGTCGEEDPRDVTFNFTAAVWDETGDEVGEGVQVELSGSGVNENWDVIEDTDVYGIARFAYSYLISAIGNYSYSATATVVINGVTYTDSVNYSIIATCDVEEEEVTLDALASPESIETGETSIISVRVTDADGVVVGQRVTFSVNNPSLGSVSPTSAVTDSSGVARTTFTAGSTAGTVTIYISSGTASTAVEVTITDAAASITASAPNTTMTLGTSTSVSATLTATATVENAQGDLIEGVAVGFSITPSASCGTANASFSPASGSGTTNIAGLAEFSFEVTATATGTCTYTLRVNTGSLTDSNTGTIRVN